MSNSQFKFGLEAIEESNAAGGGNKPETEFAKFPSGATLKVKLVGMDNLMRYFGYGVYKRVNTFIAKNPSDRNEKGYVTGNPTPWDKASQHYFDKAKAATEAGASEAEVKEIRGEGFKFGGKKRYAVGFVDIETGKQIIVDFTGKQFDDVIKPALIKYDAKRDKVAFELTKTGARADTKVAIMPVLDMDDDLTDKERANFEKAIGKEFDKRLFEGLLFEADEKTQIENLVAAGFDISLIGYTIGVSSEEPTPSDDGNIGTVEDTQEFEF